MDECDVTVVGAGPIGCFIAERLASKGRNVSLFEEHSRIGEPLHCAGLVTQRVLNLTHCPPEGIVQNTIYGAIIHSPNGKTLTIGGETIHALVIDRRAFDVYLAQKAERAGAHLFLQHTSA
ncbi:MAG: NAD(P)-binding protein, partial [Candidatus Thermoplasmatota archaeon]|nr:NAD(P)-binding protein [Candidatus Thermoplasmatota archaeon]